MTPTTQNLNAKLSPRPRAKREARAGVGISWEASAIRGSQAPVRIVGSSSRYKGGCRVNC